MLSTITLSLLFSFTPPSIQDTQDLDFRVPNFQNAPRFDLGQGVRGRNPIRDQRETRPRLERHDDDLVRLLRKEFGDKYTIIRWRDSLIIKPIKEEKSRSNKKKRNRNRRR